jgi:hypothetical protein
MEKLTVKKPIMKKVPHPTQKIKPQKLKVTPPIILDPTLARNRNGKREIKHPETGKWVVVSERKDSNYQKLLQKGYKQGDVKQLTAVQPELLDVNIPLGWRYYTEKREQYREEWLKWSLINPVWSGKKMKLVVINCFATFFWKEWEEFYADGGVGDDWFFDQDDRLQYHDHSFKAYVPEEIIAGGGRDKVDVTEDDPIITLLFAYFHYDQYLDEKIYQQFSYKFESADNIPDLLKVMVKSFRVLSKIGGLDHIEFKSMDGKERGTCLPDYFHYEATQVRGLNNLERETVYKQFQAVGEHLYGSDYNLDRDGSSIEQALWVIEHTDEKYYDKISFKAYDIFFNVIVHRMAKGTSKETRCVTIVLADEHAFGLTEQDRKNGISRLNSVLYGDSTKLDFNYCDALVLNLKEKEDRSTMKRIIGDATFIPRQNVIILKDKKSARSLLVQAYLETNVIFPKFAVDNKGAVNWFVHPTKQLIIKCCPEFSEIDAICQKFRNENIHGLDNHGQSLTSIAKILYKKLTKEPLPPVSYFSDSVQQYITKWGAIPIFHYNEEFGEREAEQFGIKGYDIRESYPNAVLSMPEDAVFPVTSCMDSVIPFPENGEITVGLYWLKSFYYETIYCPPSCYDYTSVKELLNMGVIDSSFIMMYCPTNNYSKVSPLKQYVREAKRIRGSEEGNKYLYKGMKSMVRLLIGDFGKRWKTSRKVAFTNSKEMVNAYLIHHEKNNTNKFERMWSELLYVDVAKDPFSENVSENSPLYAITLENRMPVGTSRFPIHCAVVSWAKVNLFRMIRHLNNVGVSKIFGSNTDSLFLTMPQNANQLTKIRDPVTNEIYEHLELKLEPITRTREPIKKRKHVPEPTRTGEHRITAQWDKVIPSVHFDKEENPVWEGLDLSKEDSLKKLIELTLLSFLMIGRAGTGKSFFQKILAKYQNELYAPWLSENLRFSDDENLSEEENQGKFNCVYLAPTHVAVNNMACDEVGSPMTIQRFLSDRFKGNRNVDLIVIDECTMLPQYLWAKVIAMKRKNPKLIIQAYGDPNQTRSIDRFLIDYMNKWGFSDLFDGRIMYKKYVEGVGRYPKQLYDDFDSFINTGKIPESLYTSVDEFSQINFHTAYTNKKVNKLNSDYLQRNGWDWFVGMRIRSQKTIKSKISNNGFYVIRDFDLNGKIFITDYFSGKEIEGSFDKKNFQVGYASTIHKLQCVTLKEPFCIHEAMLMQNRPDLLYTAMSRADSLGLIHCSLSDVDFLKETTFKWIDYNQMNEIPDKKEVVVTHEIYVNWNDQAKEVYVGQTKRESAVRFQEKIRNNEKSVASKGTWYYMVWRMVICDPFDDVSEDLNEAERFWIKAFQRKILAEGDRFFGYKQTNKHHMDKEVGTIFVKPPDVTTVVRDPPPFVIKDDTEKQCLSYEIKRTQVPFMRFNRNMSYKKLPKDDVRLEIEAHYERDLAKYKEKMIQFKTTSTKFLSVQDYKQMIIHKTTGRRDVPNEHKQKLKKVFAELKISF